MVVVPGHASASQLAFYVNLHRAVIGPSATLTGRWRPDIDLRRMLTGFILRIQQWVSWLVQEKLVLTVCQYLTISSSYRTVTEWSRTISWEVGKIYSSCSSWIRMHGTDNSVHTSKLSTGPDPGVGKRGTCPPKWPLVIPCPRYFLNYTLMHKLSRYLWFPETGSS